MNQNDRNTIRENLNHLCSIIDFPSIKCHLVERKIFNRGMLEDIIAQENESSQNYFMLEELTTRGPEAFAKFVEILIDTNQMEAAMKLDPKAASRSNRRPQHAHFGRGQIHADEVYKMTSTPKGLCLIINNIKFSDGDVREGSQLDEIRFQQLFTSLGFQCVIERDKTAEEMELILDCFSKRQEHIHLDASIIIILSHGHLNHIHGVDFFSVSEEKILSYFDNLNCPVLKGKPKLFFFQACRGDDLDYGVHDKFDSRKVSKPTIPTLSDFIICYATLPNYKAIRNEITGSWLCTAVVNIFSNYAKDRDLQDMLTLVTKEIMEQTTAEGEIKASCEVRNLGFRKKFYFNTSQIELMGSHQLPNNIKLANLSIDDD